jgi:hypothetical protein
VDDYNAFKRADDKFAAESFAHVIEEYYYEQLIPYAATDEAGERPAGGERGLRTRFGRYSESHLAASDFESKVLSDFTGRWEKPFEERPAIEISPDVKMHRFEFSTVIYDVTVKSDTVVSITKYEKKKSKK